MSIDQVSPSPAGALSDWLGNNVAGFRLPARQQVLPGGNSNVTLLLTDSAGQRFVLRQPPVGTALATAHDVLREARILRALDAAKLPVPSVVASCDDLSVLGVAFVVMRYVEGTHCHTSEDANGLTVPVRRAAGDNLAHALALLHALDVDSIGLGNLGPRDDYLARQLRRWRRQVDVDRQRDTEDIDRTCDLLREFVPEQRRVAVVHGDVRLDNCILSADGGVLAIVDWEICALGDPLADLGVLLAYWAEPGDEIRALNDPPTAVGGFATRSELAASYLRAADLPADTDVAFYVAFAWWKLACIVEGVWARAVRKNQQLARPRASYAEQALRLAGHARSLASAL
jgi:aminoglycoside phosphotransferase (APT) family kinase protein